MGSGTSVPIVGKKIKGYKKDTSLKYTVFRILDIDDFIEWQSTRDMR